MHFRIPKSWICPRAVLISANDGRNPSHLVFLLLEVSCLCMCTSRAMPRRTLPAGARPQYNVLQVHNLPVQRAHFAQLQKVQLHHDDLLASRAASVLSKTEGAGRIGPAFHAIAGTESVTIAEAFG
jgi:hypothetical protein